MFLEQSGPVSLTRDTRMGACATVDPSSPALFSSASQQVFSFAVTAGYKPIYSRETTAVTASAAQSSGLPPLDQLLHPSAFALNTSYLLQFQAL